MVTATFNILGVWTVNIMVLLVILVMVGSKFKTKSIDVFFNQNINKYDAKVLKNKQNENEVTHEEESGTESESGAGAGTESEIGSGTGTESEAESDKKVSRKFVPPSVEIEPDTGNPPPRSTLTPPPPKQSKTKSKQTKFSYDDTNIGQAPRSSSFFNPNFSIMDEPLHHQEDIELQLEPSQQQKQSTIPPKQSSKPEIVSGWLEVQQSPKLPPKQHEIVSGQAEIGSGQGPPEPPKQPPELPKQSEIESGQGSSEPPKQLEIEPPKQSEMVSAQSQPQTELKENENKNENENEDEQKSEMANQLGNDEKDGFPLNFTRLKYANLKAVCTKTNKDKEDHLVSDMVKLFIQSWSLFLLKNIKDKLTTTVFDRIMTALKPYKSLEDRFVTFIQEMHSIYSNYTKHSETIDNRTVVRLLETTRQIDCQIKTNDKLIEIVKQYRTVFPKIKLKSRHKFILWLVNIVLFTKEIEFTDPQSEKILAPWYEICRNASLYTEKDKSQQKTKFDKIKPLLITLWTLQSPGQTGPHLDKDTMYTIDDMTVTYIYWWYLLNRYMVGKDANSLLLHSLMITYRGTMQKYFQS